MAEVAGDELAETLPASSSYVALSSGIAVLGIGVILWVSAGAVAGIATAVALGGLLMLFVPRRLSLDAEGFQLLSLVPRRKVLWRNVDSFNAGAAPRGIRFVCYTKAGRRPRWWYPAGWPAQGSLPASFASKRGGKALTARELADLLNDRLARYSSSQITLT